MCCYLANNHVVSGWAAPHCGTKPRVYASGFYIHCPGCHMGGGQLAIAGLPPAVAGACSLNGPRGVGEGMGLFFDPKGPAYKEVNIASIVCSSLVIGATVWLSKHPRWH